MLAVTHELKSPIAAMKLNLQTLERHHLDKEKQEMLVSRCVTEANRLNDLCNNMLFASQIDGKQYVSAREQFNFTTLVQDNLKEYTSRYPNRFAVGVIEDTVLTGDKILLQMALSNLIENAIKYTPADKLVYISLFNRNGQALLQVADEGPGIPDNEEVKIFTKFYRIGNEETRKTKGTGLGLYLTAKIVKQHRGRIGVKDNVPTGAIFEIYLPLG